ncbi:MAG: metalloprotease [Candidatus Woesearchaeota archaeon]
MHFSSLELRELFKAYAAISLAFGILLWRGYGIDFPVSIFISALTVGVGFALHELSHKVVAQHFGLSAEFRAFNHFLLLAIAMSFFGFIFAAPGAVFIQGYATQRRHALISSSGVIANICAAVCFAALFLLSSGIVKAVGAYGAMINSYLALFNLIPFGGFDGATVFRWNKKLYGVLAFFAFSLLFFLMVFSIM